MFPMREAVSRSQMFFKLGVLKNLENFTGKHLCWGPFFTKVAGLKRSATLLKRDSTQMFPCEICEIIKNRYFYRTSPVATSEIEEVFNFLRFSLRLCSFLFDTCGFTNNTIFILFKWRSKRKHSLLKCSNIYFAKKSK